MAQHNFTFTELDGSSHHHHAHFKLSDEVILENGLWFISLRWLAVAIFMSLALLSKVTPDFLSSIGLCIPTRPFICTAMILFIANSCFVVFYKVCRNGEHYSCLNAHSIIWLQILFDLVTITYAVHLSGSTNTPIAFLYSLHVALSCVFFCNRLSLLVTAVASALYLSCVALEQAKIIEQRTVYTNVQNSSFVVQNCLSAFSIVAVLVALWYVVAKLAQIIRVRENELIKAYEEIADVQKEKDEYTKHATHQLKSPLDCMRSNISLILEGYIGEVDEKAADLLAKVYDEAEELGETILEELQLSHLKAEERGNVELTELDLGSIMKICITDVKGSADRRNIEIVQDISPCTIQGNLYQFKMLFNNLLSNAINYSHADSRVDVYTGIKRVENSELLSVKVTDCGIGIADDEIPFIFDEYFKTQDAVRCNHSSSGVGLAIVRKIAQLHNIKIAVESTPGEGTSFELLFQSNY